MNKLESIIKNVIKERCYLSFLLICFFSSCVTIVGFTNDYSKLSDEQKRVISPLKDTDAELINGRIYEINATQLKDLIKKYDKAIVYIFTNGCTSKYCVPLNYYVDYAEKNNYKLFLVMDGYGNLEKTINQNIEMPLFSINSQYYHTNIRMNYTKYFQNDLLNRDKNYSSKNEGYIYFFEKGKFKKVLKNI